MKRALVSVINDLSTDQRVHRTCSALQEMGYHVLLVGRILPNSLPLQRSYQTHRMRLLFKSGVLFYIEFQIRLLFYLLFKKGELFYANDLDTLLPNFILSKLKNKKLIYDSHEFFTEVPELQNNKLKKNVWKFLERNLVSRIKNTITVNDSIAKLFEQHYKTHPAVVRNVPIPFTNNPVVTREQLNLPANKYILILQGAGINIDRGAEELIQAMPLINNAVLLVVGGGDVIETLKKLSKSLGIEEKVIFKNKLPYHELMNYTRAADIGISLDKDTNINYRYSLPNKLFDYILAGIPVLASPLIEVKKIVTEYNIGNIIETHEPQHIANTINRMLADSEKMKVWKKNTEQASRDLNWDVEKQKLFRILNTLD